MEKFTKILSIIGENKWDYSKLAQITKLLGGVKPAITKWTIYSGTLSVALWEAFRLFFKNVKNEINKKPKIVREIINQRTEEYLAEREKMLNLGESVENLDEEYNQFMENELEKMDKSIQKKDVIEDKEMIVTDKHEENVSIESKDNEVKAFSLEFSHNNTDYNQIFYVNSPKEEEFLIKLKKIEPVFVERSERIKENDHFILFTTYEDFSNTMLYGYKKFVYEPTHELLELIFEYYPSFKDINFIKREF